MPARRRRSSPLARQASALALLAPQVIALRVARLALAGPRPSPRDRRELVRMASEKPLAFGRAWMAMTEQALLAQQAFALAALRALWMPWTWHAAPRRLAARGDRVLADVLGAGLRPLHHAVRANARRLQRGR